MRVCRKPYRYSQISRLLLTATTSPVLSRLFKKSPIFLIMSAPYQFKGARDRFSGVTVSSEEEPTSAQDFEAVLQASLDLWMKENIRGVWFRVALQHADWVPVLVKHGFIYHHAQQQFVMMVKWLAINEPNNIPRYAHNLVGVGAFVVNDQDELLVVRERFYTRPHWKLPGGYVEPGEDLGVAAVREVKEETGVDAEFVSLVSFRHVHGATFGCSDIYFIVHLRPTTQSITMCQRELAACQWMKIQEYIQHPYVHETNRFFAKCFLECRKNEVQTEATNIYSPSFKKNQVIYSINFRAYKKSVYGYDKDTSIEDEEHATVNGDPNP
ncbi:uncharacterized protein [Panulirus ornatus]|uniref:uncharacterized protein isoform X2 n=1 Tax=Panulirus ornatus TaxID=150431 RepID=UPI003A85C047